MNAKQKLKTRQMTNEQKSMTISQTSKPIEKDADKMAVVMQLVCW